MEYFNRIPEDILKQLDADEDGLSSSEAKQRQEKYGKNMLSEGKKQTVFGVFFSQFKDLLIIILIIAAIISAVSGQAESTIVILAVIVLNAILGTVQHFKAEKSLESLKKLSSPRVKIMRDGLKSEIDAADVVPGDIMLLEAGDMVAADARIIRNYSLKVNESSLTGESEAVEKHDEVITAEEVALADRKNMVFSGSLVTYGRAECVVVATGMDTELGKIAGLMNSTQQRATPLQKSLDDFGKRLAVLILIICAVVFALSYYRGMEIIDSLMFAVALAVAAIPEALSSIVTIVLAMGTQKMAKQNAIMKDLKAVESLGAVSVICSDKTGTLTQNKMTVQKIYSAGEVKDDFDLSSEADYMLLKSAILVNDAVTTEKGEVGDPTEIAFVRLFDNLGLDEIEYRQQHPRICELAFDSDRKLMSTVHNVDDDTLLLTKGALDVILDRSTHIIGKNGVREITAEDKASINKINSEFSSQGLRVLAFGYKKFDSKRAATHDDECDYIFTGLISMIDPPREEAALAVADAKRGGIRTVMITGDHKVTAVAIAKQLGIFEENSIAVEGAELDKMSDDELDKILEQARVYARVSPEHKIRIVSAWQRKGAIAAMTGDGVNDAPALKRADIGVAMGITGTEVSKDAASMILSDDNFATIVKAVVNGRSVYENIKNSIKFLLSGNTAGILSVLYTTLLALPIPFLPVHLLFINLLTDSLPAIAIGMENARSGLLDKQPRNPDEPILNKKLLSGVIVQGFIIAIFTMIAYHIGLKTNDATASTMAFASLTLARLFHGFNCRGDEPIFSLGIFSNKYSVGAFLAGVIFLALVLFVPALSGLFSVSALSGIQLLTIVSLALAPTVIIQLYKIVKK